MEVPPRLCNENKCGRDGVIVASTSGGAILHANIDANNENNKNEWMKFMCFVA